MPEGSLRCLMFAAAGSDAAKKVARLLEEQGTGVTRAAAWDERVHPLGAGPWHLVVIDANGERRRMLQVLSQCRQTYAEVPVLVLVERGDTETAVQAIKTGAADCLEMPVTSARLRAAIDALSEPARHEPHDLWVRLTRVEQIILGHILNDRTNRRIADLLCRSPRTIEVHRQHLMDKLGAANLAELVKQAVRAGIVERTADPRPRDFGDNCRCDQGYGGRDWP